MRSKGQISFNFGYHVNFNCLYQTLRVFSHYAPGVEFGRAGGSKTLACRVGILGCWEVKNFSVGICDGAPSTARSSFELFLILIFS